MSAAPTTHQAGVVTQLLSDWNRVSPRVHDFGPLGIRTCEEMLLELRAEIQAEDATLHTLISRAVDGDRISETVVLYFMLPKALHFARTCAALRTEPRLDATAASVGAMWEAIRTYPLHRTQSVRGNLGMNSLSIITKSFGAGLRKGSEERATDAAVLAEAILRGGGGVTQLEPEWGEDSLRDLVSVLGWAADTGALSREEVSVLARYDLGEKSERDELADALGINRDSLNRRVHRVRCKLIEAVQGHIRANGAW